MNPEKVLITGATGLVGSRLTEILLQRGHEVVHLSRSLDGRRSVKTFAWDVNDQQADSSALDGVTAIVHLAGAGIADKPWTPKRKEEIRESRVSSTRLLSRMLGENNHQVNVFVSASGVNVYGFDENETLFTEDDQPGTDFLANVVVQWEQAADLIAAQGIRTVKLRTGFVLSANGGALKELARPIKLGLGAALGSGKQRVSWIHLDDLCEMYIHAITHQSMSGAYNAAGPTPVSNKQLTKVIASVLNKPLWLPNVPSLVLRMLLGREMSQLVLKGTTVSSRKIQESGFNYKFKTLESALNDIYSNR